MAVRTAGLAGLGAGTERLVDDALDGPRAAPAFHAATKAAMDLLQFPGGGKPRAPLKPLTGEPLKGLERGLATLGLL